MYADNITKSMKKAIDETNRRREIQDRYNREHNITPKTIVKSVRDVIEATVALEDEEEYKVDISDVKDLDSMIDALKEEMMKAAEELNFEKAAELRDKMIELKKMKEAGLK